MQLWSRDRERRAYRVATRMLRGGRSRLDRGTATALARWCEWMLARGTLDLPSYYDRLTQLVIARAVARDSVCVDVGCHQGAILREMMRFAPEGTFYAFEPLPHLHRELVATFRDPRVHIYELALAETAGRTEFCHVTTNPGYSGLRERRYDALETVERIEIATDRLDDVLARANAARVALIKIDVEGAEHLVLGGASRTLREHRPIVILEHGLGAADYYGSGPERVYPLLADAGLRVSLLNDWLIGRPALDAGSFATHFHASENYYFVAHP